MSALGGQWATAQQPGAPSQSSQPATPTPVPTQNQSNYRDPLEQPIVVAPGTTQSPLTPVAPEKVPPSSLPAYLIEPPHARRDELGSTYIPVDSLIYPMAMRLYSMGYLNTSFITMRPWTRRVLLHMLEASQNDIMADGNDEAIAILASLKEAVTEEEPGKAPRGTVYGAETFYTRLMGIGGPTLRDSYHLGQTIVNDYGRPYQSGFNDITGFSSVNEMGRFSLYVRGEYQHSPSGAGYSTAMTNELSSIDDIPYPGTPPTNLNQATIPTGPIAAQNPFRLQEATLSFHLLGHEISGGKSDYWFGPALGGGMEASNNAEDIYSFRINRVEPLHIRYVSYFLGSLRYDFYVGSLKGHTYPNSPWVHSESFEFHPTDNFQFGFARGTIWGGEGHEPITLHTFLRSFFNFGDTEGDPADKFTPQDPGARYSAFNFAWRLPFMSHYVTLYSDTIAHDDITPMSAPRRAAYRPGVYISQFPRLRKLDFRIEAVSTDTSTLRSLEGEFNYYEGVQKQGYTNKGFIMGDWIGREAKGGQSWLTYHLSGNEWIQLEYRYVKGPKDFVPGGTTQDQVMVDVVKRLRRDVELNAWLQFERWKAPVPLISYNNSLDVIGGPLYYANAQKDTIVAFQITWYPKLRTSTSLTGK
jgi:hypothetical protein